VDILGWSVVSRSRIAMFDIFRTLYRTHELRPDDNLVGVLHCGRLTVADRFRRASSSRHVE
jgi:hypothetical protein